MDIKDIRKIIEMMKQNELSEFELQDEGFRIAIKRRNGNDSHMIVSAPPAAQAAPHMMMQPAPATMQALATETQPGVAPPVQEVGETIKSPMVGTFYKASSPEADPFITVGDEVTEDSVVCIVEAMKVMNEIKSEVRGTIRKILVENGTPVQFGQPLFILDPA